MTEIEKRFSMQRQLMGLVICLVICFSAAGVGGLATAGSVNRDWFSELNKPEWNPPDWVFGPVWSVLYFLMGVSGWLVWRSAFPRRLTPAIWLFAAHLLLNVGWSVVFFGLRQPGWAFAEILVLWSSIAACIAMFWGRSKPAALLMLPYFLWTTFATCLNFAIWRLNT